MHKNDSEAHLIGSSTTTRKAEKPDTTRTLLGLDVNDHTVHYLKEGGKMTSGDVQSVVQHVRRVEYEGHKAKGLETADLEKPRGLGVRTASEDFVVNEEVNYED